MHERQKTGAERPVTRTARPPPAFASSSLTSASHSDRKSDALGILRERFKASSANMFAAFEGLAAQLAVTPDAPEVVEALRRELHRVHGTAGSYGFLDASRLAARLEERAVTWARLPDLERDQRATIIRHFVSALKLAFDAVDSTSATDTGGRRKILLVGVQPAEVASLRAEASLRGYAVTALEASEFSSKNLLAIAPHTVVVPEAFAAAVAASAAAENLPVIVLQSGAATDQAPLRRSSRDQKGRFRPKLPQAASAHVVAGQTTRVPADASMSTILDLAERLTLRSGWNGATVLVVDDDPSVLQIVRYIMESDEVRIVTLDDPGRLHEQLATLCPSLLLMDIRMRGYDGVALTRSLRKITAMRDLPIILFSAEFDAETRLNAYDAGADEFLAKPIVPAELRGRIADRLERHRLRRLAEGLHPVTGLSLPPRTAQKAPRAFDALTAPGSPCTVVVLRPDAGGEVTGTWLRETYRIASAIEGSSRFVGYLDDVTLIALLDVDAESASRLFESLAGTRPDATPEWRAGIASAGSIGRSDFEAVRRAAEESLDSAPRGGEDRVRQWQPEEATTAPDVVVVEDDPALTDMLAFALRTIGLSYRVFSTGPGALEGLLAMQTLGRRPLLLLDVDLPGMDGHSLHERLRVERPGAFAVVFITVHAAEAEQIRSLKAGALDYILKPLNLRVLMAKIPGWIERAEQGS
ncbi:MAG: response regulator [Anaerolineae bacterium]|nr:response regulator [Gemmatimonadaceae bacterium]